MHKLQENQVLKLACEIPWAGNLEIEKTWAGVLAWFFWPEIYEEIKGYYQFCPDCQLVTPHLRLWAPLVPLPLIGTPFQCIEIDITGALELSISGCLFIMVLVDNATQYLEALWNISAQTVAMELLKIFSWLGLPQEILTDQSTVFMPQLLQEVRSLLRIHSAQISVYYSPDRWVSGMV